MLDVDERKCLSDLSVARRSHFLESHDLLNVIVKFYFVAIALAIVADVVTTSSNFFSFTVADATFVRRYGNGFAGLVLVYLTYLGLMKGVRGGPVVLFAPEVRMVFLSGVDTASLLRRKAIRSITQLSSLYAGIGFAFGFAIHTLGHANPLAAPLSLGLFGLVAGAVAGGTACLALGLRLKSSLIYYFGILVLALLLVAAIFHIEPNPIANIAGVATAFLSPFSLSAMLVDVVLVIGAFMCVLLVPRADLETIERHSELVSRLRFAIGMRDIRSVIVLSRSLTEDGYRSRSYARVLYRFLPNPKSAPVVRSLQSMANWSVRRYIRLVLMLLVGLTLISYAWNGTQAAYLLAVPFIYLAGMDLGDPVTNLVDRPNAFCNYPVADGWLLSRSLVAPIGVSVIASLIIASGVYLIHPATPILVILPIALSLGVSSVLGGAVGGIRSGSSTDFAGLMTPELQAMGMLIELIPVAISAAWLFPAINSHAAYLTHQPPEVQAISTAFFSLLAPLTAWAWISNKTVLKSQ